MIVAVALLDLHIEYAQSLKEKRMVVKSLRDKLRHRFEISAAEVGLQDLHQSARLGISFVTSSKPTAEALFEKIQDFVESNTDAVVSGVPERSAISDSESRGADASKASRICRAREVTDRPGTALRPANGALLSLSSSGRIRLGSVARGRTVRA